MTRSIIEKKNDFSVLIYEVSVKTCQHCFYYFGYHPRLRIQKIVNISWADGSCNFIKQHGSLLFQMTIGWSTFSPAALPKKATVNRCFDFLPPFPCFPFSTHPLSGRAFKTRFVQIPNVSNE